MPHISSTWQARIEPYSKWVYKFHPYMYMDVDRCGNGQNNNPVTGYNLLVHVIYCLHIKILKAICVGLYGSVTGQDLVASKWLCSHLAVTLAAIQYIAYCRGTAEVLWSCSTATHLICYKYPCIDSCYRISCKYPNVWCFSSKQGGYYLCVPLAKHTLCRPLHVTPLHQQNENWHNSAWYFRLSKSQRGMKYLPVTSIVHDTQCIILNGWTGQ